jgi:hypothetical protein
LFSKGEKMKTLHNSDCASRLKVSGVGCDCTLGLERRIKRKASKTLKRQRKKIAANTGLKFEETLEEKNV